MLSSSFRSKKRWIDSGNPIRDSEASPMLRVCSRKPLCSLYLDSYSNLMLRAGRYVCVARLLQDIPPPKRAILQSTVSTINRE